ncbi:MAG TPA: extracellular solute-binding protein [Bacilli bacterium]
MKGIKLFAILALCIIMLLSACSGKNDQTATPAPTDEPASTTAPTAAPAEEKTWDVTKVVDENFPFEQYVKDEKAKWHIGREAELTWYFNYNHHIGVKPFTEYTALKTVTEITGINVTGTIPNGDGGEKVRLMMATNDFPDLVTLGFDDPLGKELIEGGYVYSLDELMDKYAPEFKKEMPEILRTIGTYEGIDDQMWSISGVTNPEWLLKEHKDPAIGNFSYSVRKDIWKALGEPSIATPDDLYNTLKLFKEKYPQIDGKNSIGISGWALGPYKGEGAIKTLGYSFGINDVYCDEATKYCSVKWLHPEYPTFIAYLNKLYREGLIDPEIFVKDDQQVTQDLSSNSFMLPYVWHAAGGANAILNAKDPESHFIAIPPMSATGKEFSFPASSRVGGAVQTFISKKAKDPEAAIKLLRYGFSPTGTLQVAQGNPGTHYHVKDGVFFRPQAESDKLNKDAAAYQGETGIWDYFTMWYQPMRGLRGDPPDTVKYDIPNSVPYGHDSTNERYGMTPTGTTDEGVALTTITTIADNVYKAIAAKSAEESAKIIEKMIVDIKKVKDYDKLEKFMSDRYKKNWERFGAPIY